MAASSAAFAVPPLVGPTLPADPPLPPGSAGDPKQPAEDAAPTAPQRYPPPGPTSSPRRDYGGPVEGSTVADALLVIPRVALLPLYLLTEYVIRRPLGFLAIWGEKHYVPQRFLYYSSLGTYGTKHQIGFLPMADFEWGVRANAGLLLSWYEPGNAMRASGAVGGPDWLRFVLNDRVELDDRSALTAEAKYEHRGDYRFWGIGPSSASVGHHFTLQHAATSLDWTRGVWRTSEVSAGVDLRSARFSASAPVGPSLSEGLAAGRFASAPPGFDGYVITEQRVAAALDTRRRRYELAREEGTDFVTPSGTGIRAEGHALHAVGIDQQPREWLRYGGGLGLYKDLNGRQRTVGIAVSTVLLQRIRDTDVPFLELVSLGGPEPMRAFRNYRLLGESSLVGKLSYSWPIWTGFDGVAEAALGNVFGSYYDGFAARLLRGSFSMGFATTRSRDVAFQLLFGAGTRTIADGFGVEAFRFVAGTSSAF
jgi:hypothetical protein